MEEAQGFALGPSAGNPPPPLLDLLHRKHGRLQRKQDVARCRSAQTGPGQRARGALVAGGAHALLPALLGDVDGGAVGGGGQGELGAAALADGGAGAGATPRVVIAGDAIANGQLGGVLFVVDNVAAVGVVMLLENLECV